MAKFEIYFHGLVCFYAPEPRGGNPRAPKTMALFIRDRDHERALVTLDGDTRFTAFETISMTVSGGATGVIESSDDFQRMVPHLGEDDISKGGAFVDPSLAIQLVFPPVAGELLVGAPYLNRGDYQLGQRSSVRDVARITVLRIFTQTLTLTLDGNAFEVMRTPAGGQANCASVAHVVDHIVPGSSQQPVFLNGDHIAAVSALKQLKPENEQPFHISTGSGHPVFHPGIDPEPVQPIGEGGALEVASAARQLPVGSDVLTQTQCSNTNWP